MAFSSSLFCALCSLPLPPCLLSSLPIPPFPSISAHCVYLRTLLCHSLVWSSLCPSKFITVSPALSLRLFSVFMGPIFLETFSFPPSSAFSILASPVPQLLYGWQFRTSEQFAIAINVFFFFLSLDSSGPHLNPCHCLVSQSLPEVFTGLESQGICVRPANDETASSLNSWWCSKG